MEQTASQGAQRRPERARSAQAEATREAGGILTSAVVAVVIIGALVVGGWWFLIRSEPAPAPTIETTKTVPGGTLDGKWEIQPHLGSFVQYRVQEQFAGALESTATGRTEEVTGSLKVSGATISDVKVTADLSTLMSDKARRDEKLQTDGLQTNQFPTATFVLTEPIRFDAPPRKGQKVTADATGDLTLHGITKRVTIPLEGRWDGEVVQVVGKVPIEFADYGITPPNVGGFVSVAGNGRMELQLNFVKG
jgi:polyisoprenoid-binding protein YceI